MPPSSSAGVFTLLFPFSKGEAFNGEGKVDAGQLMQRGKEGKGKERKAVTVLLFCCSVGCHLGWRMKMRATSRRLTKRPHASSCLMEGGEGGAGSEWSPAALLA